jgi:transposase
MVTANEGGQMSEAARRRALEEAGLLHPHPERVSSRLFDGSRSFFLPLDKIQVKYEMLRAHAVEGVAVTEAAEAHGYSRAAFYLVAQAFAERGMVGLLDERRGRRGPLKLTAEIAGFLQGADPALSGAELAAEVERRFGVHLHRRTVERARRR